MSKGKLIFWLSFIATGGVAYCLMKWEFFATIGRIIAGWYTIFVIISALASIIIALSIKLGPFQQHPGFLDYFDFF